MDFKCGLLSFSASRYIYVIVESELWVLLLLALDLKLVFRCMVCIILEFTVNIQAESTTSRHLNRQQKA